MGYIEQVAVRALIYSECARQGFYSLGDLVAASHRDAGSELSEATLRAAHDLSGLDWAILKDLRDTGHRAASYASKAREIAPWFPYRAEALLHAAPPNGRRSQRAWAATFASRWDDVRQAMEERREQGFAVTHRELRHLASTAARA